jgi:tetratricopeptide (TPR) repeat protein
VPAENPRISDLRRRVEADPSSIAFAQLAEEYRRVGNYEAAEQYCRAGLQRHPGYLSARVTLGRTLIERGDLPGASEELRFVLQSAPDNLAAIRGMAEIHQRRGELVEALDYYRRALPLARHDPDLEEVINQINRELGGRQDAKTNEPVTLSFEQAHTELLEAASRISEAPALAPSRAEPLDAAPVASSATEPTVEAAPPQSSESSAGEKFLVDFDNLLQALGRTDGGAPPQVVALLSDSHVSTIAPIAAGALGAHIGLDPADQHVLDELEAWLVALRR